MQEHIKDNNELKPVDATKHALLGVVNGTITGGILSAGISAGVTYAKHQGQEVGKAMMPLVMKNITTVHYIPVVAGTAAMAALGAMVRYRRACQHNDRADAEQQSHVERLQAQSPVEEKAR